MMSKLVCVSAACLILALNGWEKEEIPDEDKTRYWEVAHNDEPQEDSWFIQLPKFLGCCHGDTRECHWWKFRSAACTGSDVWGSPFAEFSMNFGLFEAAWALMKRIDELPISNTLWSILSCAPSLLFLIYRRLVNTGWFSAYLSRVGIGPPVNNDDEDDWPEDVERSPGRNENTQLLERHRVEIELMARTIEYVQRKNRLDRRKRRYSGVPGYKAPPATLVPPDCLEGDPLVHPGNVNDPRLRLASADSNDGGFGLDANTNVSEFTEPDFEWD